MVWFHPLVWWIERRLIEEQERACDEEVLRQGGDRQVYAESILRICEFYLTSPLICVPGMTGSDLKMRIREIMLKGVTRRLSLAGRLLLTIAANSGAGRPARCRHRRARAEYWIARPDIRSGLDKGARRRQRFAFPRLRWKPVADRSRPVQRDQHDALHDDHVGVRNSL